MQMVDQVIKDLWQLARPNEASIETQLTQQIVCRTRWENLIDLHHDYNASTP